MEPDAWQTRSHRLFGDDGLARLLHAHVVVLGLGGVGGSAALALVRGGVGHISVLDGDAVDDTNLNRQELAFRSDIGKRKTSVFKALAHDINPDCQVNVYDKFLLRDEVPRFLDRVLPAEFVIDAIDSVAVKLALGRCAQDKDFKLLSVMGMANKFNPEKLQVKDLFKTHNDPIARIMRKEARKCGITHLLTLSSTEHDAGIKASPGAKRAERTQLGTTSYLPSIAGKIAAGYVISNLTGHTWESE